MNPLHLLIDLFYQRRVATRILLLLLTITVLDSVHTTFASNQESLSTRTMPLISAPKHVLVIFSYHRAEWSDNVQKGIESVFTPYQNVNFFYEYMDTKRLKTQEYLETLGKIYTEKYVKAHIDVVICVDNNALDLLVENARTLLPDTPVVFCGINDYTPALHATRPDVTGVVESGDFSDTLEIAFRARPNATKLYVITDHTQAGKMNTGDLLAALSSVAPGIQAVLTDRMSYEELSKTLQTAAPQQVAFFVSFWKDGTGRNIEPWQLGAVFRKSAIPVFGRSEWMINHGMVGGKCVTGFSQGEAAARIALQVLGGTPVSALPVDTNSPNQYLFNYRMMQHYFIDEDIFPDESIGFNLPEPFYHVSKHVGAIVLVFTALLLATLVLLAVNIHRRRQALLTLRKTTASLEQSESRYRGMIENIHDTFYRTDAQGFLIFISPSGARLLGYYSPQEMIGRPIASFWNFSAERLNMLKLMERDGVVRDYEIILVRKDESLVPVSTTSSYYHDKEGKILGVEGVFRDITERKQAEEALQESEEKYRTVADFTYNMETWRTPDDIYRYVSPSCERITGHTVAEFLADPNLLTKITHPDDQSKVIEHFLEANHGAGTQNMGIDFRILTPGDDIRWLGHSCTAVHGRGGQPSGRRESYRDITKRKQAEEEKEKIKEALKEAHDECEQRVKNRTLELQKSHEQLLHSEKLAAVGRLSASIAHEFNNPLQSIMTIITGIKKYTPLEMEEAELVDLALQECHRMKALIANLRDFFKPTSDKLSQVDLHAIVKGLLLICKKDFHTRNITIVEKYADNIPPVMGVTDQLKQVLLNLFNNATDACEGGGVITITTEKIGENIAIHIEDNGIGISSTNITHIFEPFFTTKPELKGTGLGLSVSYGIIKNHGGRIDVKSDSSKGSIFSVFLPIESVNNEQ